MTFTPDKLIDQGDGFHQKLVEEAQRYGREIIAIPLEDEEGNPRVDKNGNVLAKFAYTYGNKQTGDAELLCFYPSAKTTHFALNQLSKALQEGRLPYPKNHKEMVVVENFFEQTGGDLMYHALNADQRAFADEHYTCQHWDKEPTAIIHVVIPMPDGNFLPVTPQPLMPTEDFDVVVAEYDNSKLPLPTLNYCYRLTHEPNTDNWAQANMQMALVFIDRVTTHALYLAQLLAKQDGGPRYNVTLEVAMKGACYQARQHDPQMAELIEALGEDTHRHMMQMLCERNDLLRFEDDVIYFEGEV
jgi:hypothetical protein